MAQPRWQFWRWPRRLQARGVLGLNRRNAVYIFDNNPRCCYPRVDDKLLTKQICQARGIRVPATYAVIERNGDLRRFAQLVDGRLGPVVLEANARPGLAIQMANRHGLVPRLAFIDAQPPEWLDPKRRRELVDILSSLDDDLLVAEIG